jgi:tetrapyrrole methylase family protein / MazG family protein
MNSIANQHDQESKMMTGIVQVVAHVARLRSPTEGCVWFSRQTLQTVRRYLLEEVYEVLEPLDTEVPEQLQEELGDLLFQIIVLSQMASERDWFSLAEVLQRLNEKIIHRNPHVFGELHADSVEEVQHIWQTKKSLEKSEDEHAPASPLSGLSATMPALALCQAYIGRSDLSKTDWTFPFSSMLFDFESRLVSHPDGMETGLGRLLFMLVDLAQRHELDAEAALQKINARFRQQVSEQCSASWKASCA